MHSMKKGDRGLSRKGAMHKSERDLSNIKP